MSDSRLRAFAKQKAQAANAILLAYSGLPELAYTRISEMTLAYSITPPEVKGEEYRQAVLTMTRAAWWTQKLRVTRRQYLDAVYRDIGLVSRKTATYCSDPALHLHRDQVERNQKYLEKTMLLSSSGDTVPLAEVAEHSRSHPVIRNAELMTRLSGYEKVSQIYGHSGLFITLTCPSRFHASQSNGHRNSKHRGESPQDAHQWLVHKWSLIRAKLNRLGIRPYGFRVVEPHHDGTPHWHLLLFAHPDHTQALKRTIRRYALQEAEPGAAKHRVKFELIDPEKGSAAGYLAKYISKNIDGRHIDHDLEGNPGTDAAERITSWARTWRMRQFQSIGGPSVTVWQELRRLKDTKSEPGIEQARCAADAGDWAAYVIAMGGIDVPTNARPIRPYYAYNEQVDTTTGEITSDDTAWHGGKKQAPIKGLVSYGAVVVTRTVRWAAVSLMELRPPGGSSDPPGGRSSQARSAVLGPV